MFPFGCGFETRLRRKYLVGQSLRIQPGKRRYRNVRAIFAMPPDYRRITGYPEIIGNEYFSDAMKQMLVNSRKVRLSKNHQAAISNLEENVEAPGAGHARPSANE